MSKIDAITLNEAAKRLNISVSTFRRTILPDLKVIRPSTQTVRIPVAELERWIEKNAARE